MGYPRTRLVDADHAGFYHCMSRCVRGAFLCGDRCDYRRQWIEDRLSELLDLFAIDACGYAVMSNHLHVIARTDPDRARRWSAMEVAQRWTRLYPRSLELAKQGAADATVAARIEQQYLEKLAANKKRIATLRQRLASLSWFNKLLKEPIARRANHEDECRGHFWEGRFKSVRLLDEAAVLACMVYVDLNPHRAGMAASLKDSAFTSILQRLKVLRQGKASSEPRARRGKGTEGKPRTRRTVSLMSIDALFRMPTAQYVSLVAATGGIPVDDHDHSATLTSMGVDTNQWYARLGASIKWFGTAIGRTSELAHEAARRNASRVVNPLPIYDE